MNGAQALLSTLVDSGVDTCFANPGTSEMHLVAALDTVSGMRPVLGLFEGVATGAADGYARMAERPATTLLHLGPGLANGLANLHDARRGTAPVLNVIGDHATYHKRYDAPLESDIDALTGWLQGSSRRCWAVSDVGTNTAAAVASAYGPPGQVSSLILPADVAWSDGAEPARPVKPAEAATVPEQTVAQVAAALRSGEPAVLLLGGAATRQAALLPAARVAAATGATLLAETFPTRWERGAGLPAMEQLSFRPADAAKQLDGVRHLVLVDAPSPVTFFAHPDTNSDLVPAGCQVHTLAGGADDAAGGLEHLAELVGAGPDAPRQPAERPGLPSGELDAMRFCAAMGSLLPDGAVVVDEAITTGLFLKPHTAGAGRHDWISHSGGAIGDGMPLATGAAVASPDRPVICLQADGSAMYTISALWTHAREGLDVTTIVLNNGTYAILRAELSSVGTQTAGPKAHSLLDLSGPDLDFVSLARGMGVPASRAHTVEELADQFGRARAEPGPHLIDAVVAPVA